MNKACLDSQGFCGKNQWGTLLCQDYHYSLQKKLYPPDRHIVEDRHISQHDKKIPLPNPQHK